MSKCAAIKPNEERCKGTPIEGSDFCFAHDPERAEERRKYGSRGGKRGGRGRPLTELANLKAENKDIRERLLKGELQPGVASVAVQSLNLDVRTISVALEARQQEELEQRIEELERAAEEASRRGGHGYGS